MIDVGTRAVTSLINALLAVIISVPLYRALAQALKKSGLDRFLHIEK